MSENLKMATSTKTADCSSVQFAALLQRILGPLRSMKELAAQTAISESRLSRAKNGIHAPSFSLEEVRRLYAARYDEADTALYDELLAANRLTGKDGGKLHQGRNFQSLQRSVKKMKVGVFATLLSEGVTVGPVNKLDSDTETLVAGLRGNEEYRTDFLVQSDAGNAVWTLYWFPWVSDPYNGPDGYIQQMFSMMGGEFILDPQKLYGSRKLSMVFSDRSIYEAVRIAMQMTKLQHETSIILVDVTSDEVLEEKWLSAEQREALSFFAAPKSTN